MLTFEWNALRAGDNVLVHASGRHGEALVPAVVAVVTARKGAHGVGIRTAPSGMEGMIQWPARLTVHLDPRDPSEQCWRCQALAEAAELRPDSTRHGGLLRRRVGQSEVMR